MSRPKTHADLPEHVKRGTEIFRLDPQHLLALPFALARHIFALADEIDRAKGTPGIEVEMDDGPAWRRTNAPVTIWLPLTEVELDRALASAQSSWDYNKARYDKWASGDFSGSQEWEEFSVNTWARGEGLPELEFRAEEKDES